MVQDEKYIKIDTVIKIIQKAEREHQISVKASENIIYEVSKYKSINAYKQP